MCSAPADDSVELVPHSSEWEEGARRELTALRTALDGIPILDAQHVGSTAVPGLAAKPVLDLQVLVPDVGHYPRIVIALEPLRYEYWSGNPDPTRLFFVKGRPPVGTGRTHHVHVFANAETFEERVLFRDALIGDPALAAEYEAFKRDLAVRSAADREAYTQGKSAFVHDVVRNARWAKA